MKNRFIMIDELYEVLRNKYIELFPQGLGDKASLDHIWVDAIIKHMNKNFHQAEIIEDEKGYKITGDIVKEYLSMDVPEGSTAFIIKELSEHDVLIQFLNDVIKDLNDLNSWFKSEGFINEGRATEKLIKKANWFA